MMKPKQLLMLGLTLAMIVLAVYTFLILGRSGGGSASTYGNLWVKHRWKQEATGDPIVYHLILSTEYPKEQKSDEKTRTVTYSYENGEAFRIEADTEHAIWIDPVFGPKKIPADLNFELVRAIEATEDDYDEMVFDSAEDFLSHLQAHIRK